MASQAMPSIDCPFISVGANRHPSAADWSPSGLLAFGAGRCIALWYPQDPSLKGVHATLKGHTDRVNVVRFLPGQSQDSDILLSGSVDKTVRVWVRSSETSNFKAVWTSPEGLHKGSINAIATCAGNPSIFTSASADGTVAVFSVSPGAAITHLHSFTTAPKFYPLTLALLILPSSSALVLAVAGSASTISVYVTPSPESPFTHAATLSGHENWIRSLSFTREDPSSASSDLILASASQDKYIRLWRLHPGATLPPATAAAESKTYGLSNKLSNKAHKLHAGDDVWSITFEALLMGHEDWIYTTSWRPTADSPSTLQLLSASADSSLSIWTAEPESGIWVSISRLGEINDTKGASAATGSVGGLWTGLWSPNGRSIAAFGKTGSWRVWHQEEDRWIQGVGISGHVKEAMGCSWGKDGGYLLSTGLDQTTRLWGKWVNEGGKGSWHEMARPQIHGYDINCVAALGREGRRFVSGAEEKMVRVFDEPAGIAEVLERLCGLKEESMSTMPTSATVPALGLSNKATDASPPIPLANGLIPNDDPNHPGVPSEPEPPIPTSSSILSALSHPPLEEHLSRHTLWPEHEKLYGHGYEISAIATSPDGTLIATACKASTPEHAVIRIYETASWRELKPSLPAHALTVTSLAFSPDGERLLSVGRDRTWAVFEKAENGWECQQKFEKSHTRMVLDGAWAPDGRMFATAGRDKVVRVWARGEAGWECKCVLRFEVPATAVGWGGKGWLGVGLEDGKVEVWGVDEEAQLVVRMDERVTPDKAVTEIAWRPSSGEEERWEMAVTSEDASVRIYGVRL